MRKYTWLWDTKLMKSEGSEILFFCKKEHVDTIFLQWSQNTVITDYQEFIAKASSMGIRVHACLGERNWYSMNEYYSIQSRLDQINDYQHISEAESRLTGVHFDIEPHTLPEWGEDQVYVVEEWKKVVSKYSSDVRALGLELTVSVPFSLKTALDVNGVPMSKFMIENHDKVVIMAYRDKADGSDSILAHTEDFLAQAAIMKVPDVIVIAVETKDTSEGDKLTFAQEGVLAMNKALRLVDWEASNYRSYNGHAVHAVNYWMNLQQ